MPQGVPAVRHEIPLLRIGRPRACQRLGRAVPNLHGQNPQMQRKHKTGRGPTQREGVGAASIRS